MFRVLNQVFVDLVVVLLILTIQLPYAESVRLPGAVPLLFCLVYGITINVLFWPGGLRCGCVLSRDLVSGTIIIGLFFLLGQLAFTNLHY